MARAVALVGPPGAGKTTQIQRLLSCLPHTIRASVPLIRRRDPQLWTLLTEAERHEADELAPRAELARKTGTLAPIRLDEILFGAVERSAQPVILDGAPRGLDQARIYASSRRRMQDTLFVELTFADDVETKSLRRQEDRAVRTYGTVTYEMDRRFRAKVRTYCSDTIAGLSHLRSHVEIKRVNAEDPPDVVASTLAGWATMHIEGSVS